MHLISFSRYLWHVLASQQPAFPLPGSHTAAAEDARKFSPQNKPQAALQRGGPARAQPHTATAGGDSSCKAVSLGFKTLVCLFVTGQPRGWKKEINVILSPLSHRSAQAETPCSSRRRALRGIEEPEAPQKQLTPAPAACLGPPRCFPSPTAGTPVAWGHRWPGDNFPGSGKQHRNLHLYLHFLIAPAGFLGQRLALVSMAGFVQTPRTEGGTKGPQWTCHSPASKAAGEAGRGHCGREHCSPSPHPSTRVDVGSLPGRGRGWLEADACGTPAVSALPEQQ